MNEYQCRFRVYLKAFDALTKRPMRSFRAIKQVTTTNVIKASTKRSASIPRGFILECVQPEIHAAQEGRGCVLLNVRLHVVEDSDVECCGIGYKVDVFVISDRDAIGSVRHH